MKIVFSEFKAQHDKYIYPYCIWAYPEKGETPSDLYLKGFLPSAKDLTRFYLSRNVRVKLKDFSPSSENRRILKKMEGISFELVKRGDFDFTEERKRFCLRYAEERWGKGVMPPKRLDELFTKKITTHLLVFKNQKEEEIGIVTLYLVDNLLAHYYYSFYDIRYLKSNLGMYMMTSAVKYFAEQKFKYMYLGTCYSRNSLYKTQFSGVEFFNGFRWSENMNELKYLIARDKQEINVHLFESAFAEQFYGKTIDEMMKE